LIESIVWVLYYMLFRILMERNLTIFNESEYFVALPIVLVTQFLLISILISNINPLEVMSLIFKTYTVEITNVSEGWKIFLGMLGYMYTTIIIANIINLIPAIPVWKRPNITIIGAGDVVKNRMLPALLDNNIYNAKQISIVSDYIDEAFKIKLKDLGIAFYAVSDHSISENEQSFEQNNKIRQKIVNYIKSRSSYAVIATPTDEHLAYMISLRKEGITFAVEKPIISNKSELKLLDYGGDKLMEQGFLFSYYWLEKALPLNYFLTLNATYREFIDITYNGSTKYMSTNELSFIQHQLGKLKKIDINFFEDNEDRYWSLIKESGGIYYDMLIHSFTLLLHTTGLEENIVLNEKSSEWYLSNEADKKFGDLSKNLAATFIHLEGSIAQCDFVIKTGKFTGTKKRDMLISYEHGNIYVDFDKKECIISQENKSESKNILIKVKKQYQQKYVIQMQLFDLFIHQKGLWHGLRFDDYPSQLKVLDKMMELLEKVKSEYNFYNPKLITKERFTKKYEIVLKNRGK